MRQQNGNALVYVLIAVALLAALTYSITGDQRGQQQNQLSEAQIKLAATNIISYANAAEIVVKQMEAFGIDYDDMLFDLPGTTEYNTNTTRQIYHPNGGGLSVANIDEKIRDASKIVSPQYWRTWTFKNGRNIEWTPTSANDLTIALGRVNENVCVEINRQLYGDDLTFSVSQNGTVPSSNFFGADMASRLSGYAINALDWTNTNCLECVNKKSLCIQITIPSREFVYYNVIGSR